ncbi:dimethylarginine dimethylaminohydrolase family protein [Planococcus dechangensis]|uniref:Dimethylarginine dimethylaminohydrolase family protein n=1 Tax=Planococcus dechangensis TaxID=1176255 RepID=A0ABV9M706_9BACL
MSTDAQQLPAAHCRSEYDALRHVLLCPPRFMKITDVINDVQKRYKEENIDVTEALRQHTVFVDALTAAGVNTTFLEAAEQYPEQVFTRDIGFTIGDTVFISEMAESVRQGEEKVLQNWLTDHRIQFQHVPGHRIEGGDVIVDRDTVYIGISSRTSQEAIHELQRHVPDYQVMPIHLKEKYLHLDCVFNVLSPTEALIFPEALEDETIAMLEKRYTLIHVDADEQFKLGTNVLSIGNRRLFSQPQNKKVNAQLRDHGFAVIEVDFSEIIKSGGAFRCCTMPVVRD